VIDAVGMEAHGAPAGKLAQSVAALLPDPIAQKLTQTVGIDRMSVLYAAIESCRRGGTISLSGVYGGAIDPLGVDDYATHRVPLDEAPRAYELFQKKEDNAFKILLQP
jgi:threonine dehydrogenase-like Zn-dependent dehydrogenase